MSSVKTYPPDGFTKRLYDAWVNSDMNLTDISRQTGISRTSVYSYILGGYTPNATALAKLCKVLKVSADFLLFG